MFKWSDTYVVFQTAIFHSGHKTQKKVLRHWEQNQRLPFQNLFILPLSWVMFLLATILWIVLACDCCFFAWFPHGKSAAFKKSCQIKLLIKVWYILLALCTWYNHFPFNLRNTKTTENMNVWKQTEAGAWTMLWKKRATEPEPCSWKRAPELELRHFYGSSAALVVTWFQSYNCD